ncbi:MAG: hypothetical protein KGQ49_04475 [Verrucomicrobia bacterium]|nr:hypothetical protein [Verrucomicrobiota bacterium]MBU6446633.1 hypothetical protein [Verrucomicrobiota bacterium]MDE3047051.1 hypothetical protein [Verrucomicrobiota bacterium]
MRIIGLLFISLLHAKTALFTPPSGWEIAQTKQASPYVKIGFLGKGSGEFRPSINLAVEGEVDLSLKEYVKVVKELQMAEAGTQLRDLGTFPMQCGKGRLLEITNPSPWGDIKVLQALYVQDKQAYILTAAVLREDFLNMQKEIVTALGTLTFTDDLFLQIEDVQKRKDFAAYFAQLGGSAQRDVEWDTFQKKLSQFAHLGSYWVYLLAQEGHAKIYSSEGSK